MARNKAFIMAELEGYKRGIYDILGTTRTFFLDLDGNAEPGCSRPLDSADINAALNALSNAKAMIKHYASLLQELSQGG